MPAFTVHPAMIAPFVALLGMIALGPLFFPAWWGRHYARVAFGLAAVTLVYYLGFLPRAAAGTVLHTAHEYLSFIALIGSLFVVSGGIHLTVKGESTPLENTVFLALGAVAANVLGTTGASMLLIRPWLRMNKYRVTAHHVVFFILIISNVGGGLTPIGDPPLFLGYLKGVPFWWVTEQCWPMWVTGLGMLLAMFYGVDRWNYLRAPRAVREELAEPADQFRFDGLRNLGFLALILGAVLWLPEPMFAREGVLLAAALGSWFTTPRRIHEANHFDWHPLKEVAVLFVGIFATMMPALHWLELNAARLGQPTPGFFYWGSGSLSSVLDNAPTYLSFLKAIFGAVIQPEHVAAVQRLAEQAAAGGSPDLAGAAEPVRQAFAALQEYHGARLAGGRVGVEEIEMAFLLGQPAAGRLLAAISVGSVFFGACTYIGNGPNFMVKSIAEQQKVHAPTFLGYVVKFSLPCMLPMLLAVWWLFFRR